MTKAPYACDLHCHTDLSDGNDSPLELIQHAAQRGLEIVAITDHDKKPPLLLNVDGHVTDIIAFAKNFGIHLIRGIEISCETGIEDVHIIGLGCNWDDAYFDELEEFILQSKIGSYRELVNRLRLIGMDLSWAELLENGGKPVLEKDIQKKLIFELVARKGYAESWKEAKLLVKNSPDLNVSRAKPDSAGVIAAIRRLGGVAILAHPYLIDDEVEKDGQTIFRQQFIAQLIAAGLDGIEARYPYGKTSYSGRLTPDEICEEVMARYADAGLIISGGSDYHADYKKGTKNPRELGECGITLEAFRSYAKLKNI